MIPQFTVDFETTTSRQDENSTRVWLWGIYDIYQDYFEWGKTIEEFFRGIFRNKKSICYFRNLKFDGSFILYYCLVNGYEHTTRQYPKEKQVATLIDDMGHFYSIKIKDDKGNVVEFRDSAKIIPLSIAETPKAFGLEESKGEIDYHKIRPLGYEPDANELDYLKHDISIDAKALRFFFDKGLQKMTQGSNALFDFKLICKNSGYEFTKIFPPLQEEIDLFLRPSYKGGYVLLNRIYKNKTVENGIVADVNSLFPSRMYYCQLPYGEPTYFSSKYQNDKMKPLYVQRFRCMFELKKGKLPMLQIKGSYKYKGNEYLTSSHYEIEELTLCNVDLEMFFDHYHVDCVEYLDGYKFKTTIIEQFVTYIDKWNEIKVMATNMKNTGLRTVAKYMLNTLYGKFGTRLDVCNKIPYINEEKDKLSFYETERTTRQGVYLPVAIFITSYARKMTIETSQKVRDYSLKKYGIDKYIYSDTDSIHTTLTKEEFSEIAEVHATNLGAWDIEKEFEKAKYIRQKCYIYTVKGKNKVTVAGMPKSMHELVTYNNFKENTTYTKTEGHYEIYENGKLTESGISKDNNDGKLRFKQVSGGALLLNTDFTIKK